MNFQRKSFEDARAVIISEKPLAASQLEERISSLIPAMEATLDSFETYLETYEHCSENKRVGMFYLHYNVDNKFPINMIDECASSFEAIGCSAGLYIIAESEKAFTSAYQHFGTSKRLLKIVLESDLKEDSNLKEAILESWQLFKNLQKSTALPEEELNFIQKITAKSHNIEPLVRINTIISSKIDKNWYEELIIESAPSLLLLPEQQKWVLNNSESLRKVNEVLDSYRNRSPDELLNSKADDLAIRGVMIALHIFQEAQNNRTKECIDNLTQGNTAFSPTLKRILNKEKSNILEVFQEESKRMVG